MTEEGGDRAWVVDTSIIVHVLRATQLGRHIVEVHQLRARVLPTVVSVVTVGELLSLARQLGWGDQKVQRMREILAELVVADINNQPVLDAYAEIDQWCRQNGRKLGKNDLWIAATAVAIGAAVVTSDKDFQPLHEFMPVHFFDPHAEYPGRGEAT